MRLLGSLVVVLVLLLPPPARAQSVQVTDLAGTWAATSKNGAFKGGGNYTDTLVIRPDSTFRWPGEQFRRLPRLAGDSIVFMGGAQGFKITLTDQQLTLSGVSGDFVGKRVDAPKPTP